MQPSEWALAAICLAGQAPGGDAHVEVDRIDGRGLQDVEHVEAQHHHRVVIVAQLDLAPLPVVGPDQRVGLKQLIEPAGPGD